MTFTRKCPTCQSDIVYKNKRSLKVGTKRNKSCKKCIDKSHSIPDEIIHKILELNDKRILNIDIANMLNINNATVSRYLKQYGKKSHHSQSLDLISAAEARCSRCKDIQDINEFNMCHRPGYDREYRLSYCKKCCKKSRQEKLNNDVKEFLYDKFKRLKSRMKKAGMPFNITKEYFIQQFINQNGKCFYTNETMLCKIGIKERKNSIVSLDKIIPRLGYIEGNIVFCCDKINTCKNDLSLSEIKKWMPKWYKNIINHFKKNDKMDWVEQEAYGV